MADAAIPPAPPREGDVSVLRSPESRITVKIDNEWFVSEPVYPLGDNPPFSVNTGFRFPAPVGQRRVKVVYGGCDGQRDEEGSVSAESIVAVEKGFVTPMHFDGISLVVDGLRKDNVVTLQDIDRRLQRVEQILESR